MQTDLDIQHLIQSHLNSWRFGEWAQAQQAYYLLIKSRHTGKQWVVALLKKFWDIAWDLWEHRNGILHEA